MNSAAIRRIAAEKLGGWRMGMRGELRALPRLLEPRERVVTMGLGTLEKRKGRLCVATDRRLLLVSKWPLRPVRCESISLEGIRSLRLTPKDVGGELSLETVEGPVRVEILNSQRAEEIAQALSGHADRGRVASEHPPDAAGSLSLTACLVGTALVVVTAATWTALVLWIFGVLAFLPGLIIAVAGTAAQFFLGQSWRRVRGPSSGSSR